MVEPNTSTLSDLIWDLVPLVQLLPEWQASANAFLYSVTQRISWVKQWQAHVNPDCFCVIARSIDGDLKFVLTLEVVKQGPLITAGFPGGSHANENFVCVAKSCEMLNADLCLAMVKAQIKAKRADIDVVYLNRQVQFLDGISNPLLQMTNASETDVALSFVPGDSFETLLALKAGSSRQKRNRKAKRRMDEQGGWAYSIVNEPAEVSIVLEKFFALKAKRFVQKGIPNVFASEQVCAFFNALFAQSLLEKSGEYELHFLKLAGDIVAITGNMRLGTRLSVDFNGMDNTDPRASHGDFLDFQMIENACQRGVSLFSFGIGDEPYKRAWCDIETLLYNTSIPITLKGTLAATATDLKTKLKRAVKSNKRFYYFLKNLRKSRSATK